MAAFISFCKVLFNATPARCCTADLVCWYAAQQPQRSALCAHITLHLSESSQKGGCCACRVNDILDAAAFKHGKLKLKVEEVGALLAACHVLLVPGHRKISAEQAERVRLLLEANAYSQRWESCWDCVRICLSGVAGGCCAVLLT